MFLKLRNSPDILRDDWEGKIIENITLKYLSKQASFMGNPLV